MQFLFTAALFAQIIANPYAKVPLKKKAALPRPTVVAKAELTTEQIKAREKLDNALDELYRCEQQLAERGRIWAKTDDEFTDIRIVESNLSKASDHYSSAERHWEAGSYDDWLKEINQVHDLLKRAHPQVQRIDSMIRARGGVTITGGLK